MMAVSGISSLLGFHVPKRRKDKWATLILELMQLLHFLILSVSYIPTCLQFTDCIISSKQGCSYVSESGGARPFPQKIVGGPS